MSRPYRPGGASRSGRWSVRLPQSNSSVRLGRRRTTRAIRRNGRGPHRDRIGPGADCFRTKSRPEPGNPPTRSSFVPKIPVMASRRVHRRPPQADAATTCTPSRRSLESETAGDEVDAWRATIAIDRALRHSHRTPRGRARRVDAAQTVQRAASSARHGASRPRRHRASPAPRPKSRVASSPAHGVESEVLEPAARALGARSSSSGLTRRSSHRRRS